MRLLLCVLASTACTTDHHLDEPRPGPLTAPAVAKPAKLVKPARPAEPAKPEPARPTEIDPRFVATIRAASAPYAKWGRVDEKPNIAPMLCDMPHRTGDYGSQGAIHISEAADAPHGKKLYYLWASDRRAYLELGHAPIANGFTIVKQAFAAKPTTEPKREFRYDASPLYDAMQVDGHWMTTGEAKGLYVMTKLGAQDGTDAGWVYGTIDPAGEVTSAGRVATCIGCHEDAPHDRLFGLKTAANAPDASKPLR